MANSQKPGDAWVWNKSKGKWVKPQQPSGDYAWDDDKGWVTKEVAASIYALPLSVISADSTGELQALFDEAWKAQKSGSEWTQEMFTVKLQNTNWFKSRSESQQKYFLLSNDTARAAEFKAQVSKSASTIQDFAAQLGATLSSSELDTIAKDAMRLNYSDADLKNILSTYISFKGKTDEEMIGSLVGLAGDTEDELRKMAKDYGVGVSNSWILDQVKSVAAGDTKTSDLKKYFVDLAKQQYSQWADQIDENRSIDFLASGYKQVVAEELGKDYQSLDMNNEYVKQAMNARDDKGAPISMDALAKTLRSSDEWGTVTKNKNKIVATGQALLNKMGMM